MARETRPEVTQPRLGVVGYLRWAWRQLTSMRTALFLLLLLAVGAVPGSVFPQRSIDPARTADWIARHETTGPWLDKLGAFEVYSSPWFSAIYLLLFISLIGCIVPRTGVHWRALRSKPPRAPKRLARLEAHASGELAGDLASAREAATRVLRRRRFRVASHDDVSVSAEKGYAKETGNLVFHTALVTLIIGVAVGHLWGWKADVVVPSGDSFVNTVTRYDTFAPGPLVDESSLSPFAIEVEEMTADFNDREPTAQTFGQPRDFEAHVKVTEADGNAFTDSVKVNHPLEMQDATVFLLGNGYAPVVTVKDDDGKVLYQGATPFLAQDGNYRSTGAIKVGAASPEQFGFVGLFLPTAYIDPDQGPISVFPDTKSPALAMSMYTGELFPDGRPQSVFTLDTASMTKVETADGSDQMRLWLTPGEGAKLPGDRGTITFDGVERFAGFSVRHDPGKGLTLWSALFALAGLIATLTIKRRRVFVRLVQEGDVVRVDVGGMSKDDDEGLLEVVEEIRDELVGQSRTS
ncbi:cytochrome c biogenesis protein ResB [Janibacter hoylei]|uniref:Cytochrome c biogenesis protein ResB n=1 Tax=Janibacter hoylei PVAS-1 TaxID=1210046 RepID=K1E4G6_9MICO|nr:cytochrome c biogenesis protein ResB [Janibacter hoylei]EKA61976.1 ResB family protein [Janibacter hoylei PVAS-1]RWU82594.1 cytochrome c biogenesis protein ResB [Janibacter hoylei PVAS-1]